MGTYADITGIGISTHTGAAARTPRMPRVQRAANGSADELTSAATGAADGGSLSQGPNFAAVLAGAVDNAANGAAATVAAALADDMVTFAEKGAGSVGVGVGAAGATASTTPTDSGDGQSQKLDLSTMLADALRHETTIMGVAAGGKLPGMSGVSGAAAGASMFQGEGIEQAILAAASTGQVSDAQIALMMLCTMMQTSENGDFSMMMQMMATMLTRIQGDTETLRADLMQADVKPFVLDAIDRQVFHTRIPDTSSTGEVILPLEIWRPTTPAFTNAEGERSPELYRAVIDQFNVERAARYRPHRDGYTYCNIFVWDVTSAMGAEIPHYTEPSTGEPRYYPDIKGTNELGAIAIDEWLRTQGRQYGWREADAETAQRFANEGKPAVTTAGRTGHVQVVCPSKDGEFDENRGVAIAQAGSKVRNYAHISDIYGNGNPRNIRYFVHE